MTAVGKRESLPVAVRRPCCRDHNLQPGGSQLKYLSWEATVPELGRSWQFDGTSLIRWSARGDSMPGNVFIGHAVERFGLSKAAYFSTNQVKPDVSTASRGMPKVRLRQVGRRRKAKAVF